MLTSKCEGHKSKNTLSVFGCRRGSVIVSGVLIFALTSLLASDWFFLFATIGLVVKSWLSVRSDVMRCQLDRMVCFISWLLSLYLIGITRGWVSLRDVDDRILSLSLNCMELIWFLMSKAL